MIIIGILVGVIAVSLTSVSVGVDYKLYGAEVYVVALQEVLLRNNPNPVKGAHSRYLQLFWPGKNYL